MSKIATTTYKGWEVEILMGSSTTSLLGGAQSLSMELSTNVDVVYGVGHMFPAYTRQGPKEISGSLEKMYGDDRLWNAISPNTSEQDYFTIKAQCSPDDSDERILTIDGVKFDSWSLDLPQDDFVSESVDFIGTAFTLTGSAATVQTSPEVIRAKPATESDPGFACPEPDCDFVSDTETGLKIHRNKAHQTDAEENEIEVDE